MRRRWRHLAGALCVVVVAASVGYLAYQWTQPPVSDEVGPRLAGMGYEVDAGRWGSGSPFRRHHVMDLVSPPDAAGDQYKLMVAWKKGHIQMVCRVKPGPSRPYRRDPLVVVYENGRPPGRVFGSEDPVGDLDDATRAAMLAECDKVFLAVTA